MGMRIGVHTILLGALVLTVSPLSWGAKKPKLEPQELIANHLDSIGSTASRSARKSLRARGIAKFEVVNGQGLLGGSASLLSDGSNLRMSIVFGVPEYPGEELAFDGDKVKVGQLRPGVRTALGQFFYQFDEIIEEGLFGGALYTDWALLNLDTLRPKLKYEGLKKVDGTGFHTLKYQRRKGGDATTRLYFDKETFRHCHTIYRVRISAPMVRNNNQSVNSPETWYTLRESFSNFYEVGTVTLPFLWIIEHTASDGRTGTLLRWTVNYNEMLNNIELDETEFDLDLDAY